MEAIPSFTTRKVAPMPAHLKVPWEWEGEKKTTGIRKNTPKDYKWANGKGNKAYADIPTPKGRPVGKLNITDIPTDLDLTKIMPLPYNCWRCDRTSLTRGITNCRACGALTPVGDWLKQWGKS